MLCRCEAYVVEEEDRRFGLPESDNEHLTMKIGERFKELDEKPKLEATKLRKTWLKLSAVEASQSIAFQLNM